MQERYIASADLGTSKIALTVAKVCGDNVQIIYYCETPSEGIAYSVIRNPGKASAALRKAVDKAQDELRIEIRQLLVGLPRYYVKQETASGRIDRSDPDSCITPEEAECVKNIAMDTYPLADEDNSCIYGAVAQSFGTEDIFQGSDDDIVGATSSFIDGNFKVFIGNSKAKSNLQKTLNLANIAPAGIYFMPDITAQAVLTELEKENGVGLVEIGAGVTSLSIYQGGIMRHYGAIPFGGKSITTDIKYECGIKEVLAENIKLAFGACMPEKLQSMSEKIIQISDDEVGSFGKKLPVKYLSDIITCRATEIIEAILFLIQDSSYSEKLRNGIVITGGGANLANLTGLVKEMSGYNVRLGFPLPGKFTADGCNGISETSASASVGMILTARKDKSLNCTSEPMAPKTGFVEEPDPAQEPEPDYQDTVFGKVPEQEVETRRTSGGSREQRTPRPSKQESRGITWIKHIGHKVGKAAGNALDGAHEFVGGLYDETE